MINRPTEHTFRTAPNNVAGENYFNRIEVEGMDPNAVEKALAQFEGEIAPALERIKAAKSLAKEEDRSALVNLLAAVALKSEASGSHQANYFYVKVPAPNCRTLRLLVVLFR